MFRIVVNTVPADSQASCEGSAHEGWSVQLAV